ncbi:hypothetical protein X975_12622, partial [Stegodyphus mimosarum]
MSDGKDQSMNSAYQTGPAIYQISSNIQSNQPEYSNAQTANSQSNLNHQYPSNIMTSAHQHFVDTGNPQNQQYITIGVSPIQTQVSNVGLQNIPNAPAPQISVPASQYQQQQNTMPNQVQYPVQQNSIQQQYSMTTQMLNSNEQPMTPSQIPYSGQQATAQQYQQGQYQDQQNMKLSQNTQNSMQVPANPQQITQQLQAHQQVQLLIQQKLLQQQAQQQQQLQTYTDQQGKSSQTGQPVVIPMRPGTGSQPQQHLGISISTIQQPIMQVNPKQQQPYEGDSSYQVMPQLHQHASNQQIPQQQHIAQQQMPQQYMSQQQISQHQMSQPQMLQQYIPQPQIQQQHMTQQMQQQHMTQQMPQQHMTQQMPQQHITQQMPQQHTSQHEMPQQQQQQMYSNAGQDNDSDNPQYVSIGIYPFNIPASPDNQNIQQYYNAIMPPQKSESQSINNLGSKEENQNMNLMGMQKQQMSSDNSQTHSNTGYQLISIDLSTIANQNAVYQMNSLAEQKQQSDSHEQMKANQEQSYGGNSYDPPPKQNVQQILIHIPHNLVSEQQSQSQNHIVKETDVPYTGTAQVANFVDGSNKISNNHISVAKFNGGRQHRLQTRPPFARPSSPQRVPKQVIHEAGGLSFSMSQANFPHSLSFQKPDFDDFRVTPFPPQKILQSTSTQINSVRFKKYPENLSHQSHRGYRLERYRNSPQYPKLSSGFGNSPLASSMSPHSSFRHLHPANLGRYKSKSVVPPIHGHPGVFSSSNAYFTSISPAFTKHPFNRYNPSFPPSVSLEQFTSKTKKPRFITKSPSDIAAMHHNPFQSTFAEELLTEPSFDIPGFGNKGLSSVSHNLTNNLGVSDLMFDEIDEFLDPSYELFGGASNLGQGKKPTDVQMDKFLQKITSDILSHDVIGGLPKVPPPIRPVYNAMKPLPNAFRVPPRVRPHLYNYFAYAPANFGKPPIIYPTRSHYGHFVSHRHPLVRGHRPHPPSIVAPKGVNRNRGIIGKLLRNALLPQKMKSKITPREEVKDEDDSREDGKEELEDLRRPVNASPRSTIIKTDRYGLDGISIPLNIEHALTSRISDGDEEDDDQPKPPIIVYKGVKPPIEVYGSKEDIEKNKDENSEESEDPLQTSSSDQQTRSYRPYYEDHTSFDSRDGLDYADMMYSLLPEFIKHSLSRRSDLRGSSGKHDEAWHPVKRFAYPSADDIVENRNVSDSKVPSNASSTEPLVDSPSSVNLSDEIQSAIKEDVDELIILQKEEKSDLVAH